MACARQVLAGCSHGVSGSRVCAGTRARGHAVKFLHARSRARVSSQHSGHKRKLPQTSRESLCLDLWRVQIRARTASKPQTMKIIRKIRALVSDATFRYSFGSVSSKFIRTTIPPKSKARFAVRAYRSAHYRPGLRHARQTMESRWSSRRISQKNACPTIHAHETKPQTMVLIVLSLFPRTLRHVRQSRVLLPLPQRLRHRSTFRGRNAHVQAKRLGVWRQCFATGLGVVQKRRCES